MGLNVQLLRDTFAAVSPNADDLARHFYQTLFERYPAVRPLFANARFDEQKKKLIRSLALIVRNLEKADYLKAYLGGLGQMHVAYGALEAHYPAVGECLLVALEKVAGSAWNDEIKQAWTEAYGVVAQMMLDGAQVLGEQAPEAKETAA
jgi:hemoglobin-like flavoprotein